MWPFSNQRIAELEKAVEQLRIENSNIRMRITELTDALLGTRNTYVSNTDPNDPELRRKVDAPTATINHGPNVAANMANNVGNILVGAVIGQAVANYMNSGTQAAEPPTAPTVDTVPFSNNDAAPAYDSYSYSSGSYGGDGGGSSGK